MRLPNVRTPMRRNHQDATSTGNSEGCISGHDQIIYLREALKRVASSEAADAYITHSLLEDDTSSHDISVEMEEEIRASKAYSMYTVGGPTSEELQALERTLDKQEAALNLDEEPSPVHRSILEAKRSHITNTRTRLVEQFVCEPIYQECKKRPAQKERTQNDAADDLQEVTHEQYFGRIADGRLARFRPSKNELRSYRDQLPSDSHRRVEEKKYSRTLRDRNHRIRNEYKHQCIKLLLQDREFRGMIRSYVQQDPWKRSSLWSDLENTAFRHWDSLRRVHEELQGDNVEALDDNCHEAPTPCEDCKGRARKHRCKDYSPCFECFKVVNLLKGIYEMKERNDARSRAYQRIATGIAV
jgi:hypothetical protein